MNDVMEHKGYAAVVRPRLDDEVFHGTLINVSDSIHFEGQSIQELKRAFKKSVDFYLDFCKKRGEEPDMPHNSASFA